MKKSIYILLYFISILLSAQQLSYQIIVDSGGDGHLSTEYTFQKDYPNKNDSSNLINSVTSEVYLSLESFETWPPAGWEIYNEGVDSWVQDNSNSYSGTASASVTGQSYSDTWLISPAIDLINASSAILSYYQKIEHISGETEDLYPEILVSDDYEPGTEYYYANWYTLSELEDFSPQPWNLKQWNLSDFLGETIHVAFYLYYDGGLTPGVYNWYIDDLNITDDGSTDCNGDYTIPDCASVNSPPDGALSMQLNVPISWSTIISDNITKQLLYVGTDGNGTTTPTNIHNGTEQFPLTSGITLTGLNPNTTYYWQIVPANCAFEAQDCPIWSFTTGDGNINYGGGSSTQGGYFFANSTSEASGEPYQPIYNWIDISSTGTDIISSIGNDQTVGPFNIGFNFDFFNNTYSQFYINSNGFITFENTTGQTNFPHPFPSTNGVNNLIAGYYMDLDPTNSIVSNRHIYYGSDNGNMVITFEKIPQLYWDGNQYIPADANGWITFQIILNQNGNVKIQFKEKGSSFIVTDFYTGEVGIENADGTEGVLYSRNFYGGPIFDGTSPLAVEFFKSNLVEANVEISVNLEGPYNSGNMNSFLAVPTSHPYSSYPWLYEGTESISETFLSVNNIVDWVYIELRLGETPETAITTVSRRAALLKETGEILDTDGSTDIHFGQIPPGNYYIAVYHRNHLPILSSDKINFANNIEVGL